MPVGLTLRSSNEYQAAVPSGIGYCKADRGGLAPPLLSQSGVLSGNGQSLFPHLDLNLFHCLIQVRSNGSRRRLLRNPGVF